MDPRTGPSLTTVSLSQLSDVGQYDESLSLSPPPALSMRRTQIIYRMKMHTLYHTMYCFVPVYSPEEVRHGDVTSIIAVP